MHLSNVVTTECRDKWKAAYQARAHPTKLRSPKGSTFWSALMQHSVAHQAFESNWALLSPPIRNSPPHSTSGNPQTSSLPATPGAVPPSPRRSQVVLLIPSYSSSALSPSLLNNSITLSLSAPPAYPLWTLPKRFQVDWTKTPLKTGS